MNRVVHFNPDRVILERAKRLIDNPGLLFQDNREQEISCLLRALRLGDMDTRRKIIILLGSIARDETVWPLYEIMTDSGEPCELREQAAIHINVLGPFMEHPQALVNRLVRLVEEAGHDLRVLAIIALGWEGNHAAELPLVECLYDVSEEIKEVAALSLCNIKDSRIFGLLADRLENASFDQKRAILYSIWRFSDRTDDVLEIYRKELERGDRRLRLDVLILLDELGEKPEHAEIYMRYIHDEDPRIRALALERLGAAGHVSPGLAATFLDDRSMDVKRAALRIIQAYRKKTD